MTMQSTTKKMLATYIGAAFGFVSFVFLGAIPGVLYGGYAGLTMNNILFGGGDPSLMTRVMTFGGMALGFLAALFLFLIVGAILGTAVGAVARVFITADAHKTEAAQVVTEG
jgi:hypothetical protein